MTDAEDRSGQDNAPRGCQTIAGQAGNSLLTSIDAERKAMENEIERLRDALKRIASGWPKPMQLARETLDRKA